ncbi:RDD family protein [Blastococcus sp. VKM Ac-2987]|uniref:RDD family protein n=1 Tax=Blastococcus sp. VKM Ac-2987 TaxID=3004141 RepID=UPI0022ABBC5E|nr:hypothetical protein [Blastococcus sp. VKM Ac-2987]MCZ2857443.1 hypothetical protein [Blastococcus sp. VKM Ac-2987]
MNRDEWDDELRREWVAQGNDPDALEIGRPDWLPDDFMQPKNTGATRYTEFGPLGHEQTSFGPPSDPDGWGMWKGMTLANGWNRGRSVLIDWSVFLIAPIIGLPSGMAWLLFFANVVVLQARTGRSLGKYANGTQLIVAYEHRHSPDTGVTIQPGMGRLFVRQLLHVFDLVLLIGLVLITFSHRRQSIADRVTGTLVIPMMGNGWDEARIMTLDQAREHGFWPLKRIA